MLPKSNSTSAIGVGQQVKPQQQPVKPAQQPQPKPKPKKEEPVKNGPDEFTSWCTKTLTAMKSSVDSKYSLIVKILIYSN